MASFLVRSIPNTLTCCNLISGAIATKIAFEGHLELALTFIIIGAVFDFFDGFSARLLHVSSPIGKELDSLADVTSFGMAPSAIVFTLLASNCSDGLLMKLVPYAAFLIAAFSALRLAKFNLDERQTTSFIGLPTPANALFWGAFAIGCKEFPMTENLVIGCIILILFSCWLLVSEIPMFALKFKNFKLKDNALRYGFILTSIALIAAFRAIGITLAIVWYVLLSVFTQRKK